MHQRAPKTRELPGPSSGPCTPAERTSRSWCALRPQKYFFNLKICFFKLNNTFFESDRLAALHVWHHLAHKFSSLSNDSWVQSWGIDMLNLHDWLRTSIMHLLWEKVKCACACHGAQHSAESYGRSVVYR